jgi:hypothetical protein
VVGGGRRRRERGRVGVRLGGRVGEGRWRSLWRSGRAFFPGFAEEEGGVRREAHDKISEAEIVVFGEVQKGTIMQRTMRLKEAAGV